VCSRDLAFFHENAGNDSTSARLCAETHPDVRVIRAASSADLASFTSPFAAAAGVICALTTTGPPSRLAISATSAGVVATSPAGTGTPCRARIAFAWSSWICTERTVPGRAARSWIARVTD
jgi:hypothetical protein